ncbi:hypothetical protein RJ640_019305 [Escallonia rubra]|uniref:Mitochondrial acidic protein MAM33 n=1 Tax=Escallonia rubra TaxID=112253 RepID=A0AA88RHS0_9ASTE|nr:hypothetical protein RJ640_019305 [Escallonia rubra]
MTRATKVLRQGLKAAEDSNLLKALQSEITHELSSNPYQNTQSGSLGDFTVEYDSPKSRDMVLQRKCESGEEVAVSALLGDEVIQKDSKLPMEVLMKVCIKKPGLSSILQFDCKVPSEVDSWSGFDIKNAYYLQPSTCLDSSAYRGPLYSSLDPELQGELKNYLTAKGIGESLANFLLLHLHKKEQDQYVNWLQRLEATLKQKSD